MRVRARLIRSRLLTLTYKMGWTHRLKIYSIQHVKVQYPELSQDCNLGPRSTDKTLVWLHDRLGGWPQVWLAVNSRPD